MTRRGSLALLALYIWSGDLEYFEGRGRRLLTFKDDFGGLYAQVSPLQ